MNLRLTLFANNSPMRNIPRDDLRRLAYERAIGVVYEAEAIAAQQVQALLFKQGGYCTCCECDEEEGS